MSALTKSPTATDIAIGARLTALRKVKGISQTVLGAAIGVTFQQVQKYEKGQNRVGAGRLREIAATLGVPVAALFGDEAKTTEGGLVDLLAEPGAADLLRIYAAITDPRLRAALLAAGRSLVRSDAQAEG